MSFKFCEEMSWVDQKLLNIKVNVMFHEGFLFV
jgi:hypothetical protein